MTTTSPMLNNESATKNTHDSYTLLEQMMRIPFSQSTFLQYSKSLTQAQKNELAKILKLELSKKWSDLLFNKKISLALKKITTDTTMLKQVTLFISRSLIQPEQTLEQYENELEQYIETYHYWRVYWSLYYHSERLVQEERVSRLLELMPSLLHKNTEEKAVTLTSYTQPHSLNEQHKQEKKMALLEAKVAKEAQMRIQMEQEIVKLEKQNRLYKQEIEKNNQINEQLKQKFNESLQQLEKQEQHIELMQRKKREEEERWLQERYTLLQQIKQLSEEVKKQTNSVEQLNTQLDETKKQVISLTQSQNQLQKLKEMTPRLEQEKTEKLISALQHKLHKRIEQDNQYLLGQLEVATTKETVEQKQRKLNYLKETLTFIEYIDQYLLLRQDEDVKKEESIQLEEPTQSEPQIEEEPGIYGTFYRRDHGGYVELETNERFNITESLVQQLELQHEAEVLCIPNHATGKQSHYTIQIVFQGDDAYSPITQYDGYVHIDSDNKWYCIDMNDETRKFPIHFKDIDIQKPGHGDPCTFNVANDGYIARLTKLYRLLPGETYESTFTTKKAEKTKVATPPVPKEKREPYLTGCTITIIGGQRKWFESVVKETGAELVHNGGERPERIAADLARSQALFMILTSTSHRATWEGIEIAKANQIPHFTIQGSKSNLRSLLWENQHPIKETNRQLR